MGTAEHLIERIEALRKQAVTDRDTIDAIVKRWGRVDLAQLLRDVTAALTTVPAVGEARKFTIRAATYIHTLPEQAADLNEDLYMIRDALALLGAVITESHTRS